MNRRPAPGTPCPTDPSHGPLVDVDGRPYCRNQAHDGRPKTHPLGPAPSSAPFPGETRHPPINGCTLPGYHVCRSERIRPELAAACETHHGTQPDYECPGPVATEDQPPVRLSLWG